MGRWNQEAIDKSCYTKLKINCDLSCLMGANALE